MKTIGILGGGQLGRMFLQNAMNYPFRYHVLDPSAEAPAKHLCHQFVPGDFTDYDTVLRFAEEVDVLTIEIEHVNIEALYEVEKRGKTVIPSAYCLETIQNKALQKQAFQKNDLPTSEFHVIEKPSENPDLFSFPYVQKTQKGGYDGKGVQMIKSTEDTLWEVPSVIEKAIEIHKELAVIVAIGENESLSFPTVEMVFDPELNLVEELFSPAQISSDIDQKAQSLALEVASVFNSKGLFAVELFLDKQDQLWVNEVAPRLHNSGHHTIEGNYQSQFDILLRILMDLPLGSTEMRESATMINVIGSGKNNYSLEALENLASMTNTYFHWYGKKESKMGRKMGHITVLGERTPTMQERLKTIKKEVQQII